MTSEQFTLWFAGLFEGEGYTGVQRGRVRLSLGSTDRDVLEKLQTNLGGHIYATRKRKEHWKDFWKWELTVDSEARCVLERIMPYMGERRTRQIAAALSQQRSRRVVGIHCPQGHLYSGRNNRGAQICHECGRDARRRHLARKAA